MKPIYKIFATYILLIIFILVCGGAFGQVVVTHFNASWNDHNKADWVDSLTDCEITYVDIAKSPKIQKRHKITVVPTVVVFKDGEEMYRFESDVSFKLIATRKELQEYIDELIEDRY
jgi:hypothetical protein